MMRKEKGGVGVRGVLREETSFKVVPPPARKEEGAESLSSLIRRKGL